MSDTCIIIIIDWKIMVIKNLDIIEKYFTTRVKIILKSTNYI